MRRLRADRARGRKNLRVRSVRQPVFRSVQRRRTHGQNARPIDGRNNRLHLRRIFKTGGRILDNPESNAAGRVPDHRPPRQPKNQHQRPRRRRLKKRVPRQLCQFAGRMRQRETTDSESRTNFFPRLSVKIRGQSSLLRNTSFRAAPIGVRPNGRLLRDSE